MLVMKKLLGKWVFRAMGWSLEGRFPSELPKKILIVAPHTSYMDFFVGIPVKFWLDIKADWYGKQSLFRGLQGRLLRSIGGHAVDRNKHQNLVSQVVYNFKNLPRHTILITPEGTRKKVAQFKTGFYQIALQAQVPIVPIIFDYSTKKIKILNQICVHGLENEIEQIEDLFKGAQGKYLDKSF